MSHTQNLAEQWNKARRSTITLPLHTTNRWVIQSGRKGDNSEAPKGIIMKRGFPKLHHIYFADDSLFFIQGTVENV